MAGFKHTTLGHVVEDHTKITVESDRCVAAMIMSADTLQCFNHLKAAGNVPEWSELFLTSKSMPDNHILFVATKDRNPDIDMLVVLLDRGLKKECGCVFTYEEGGATLLVKYR